MKKIIISDTEKDNIRQMHESFKQNGRVFLNETDDKYKQDYINQSDRFKRLDNKQTFKKNSLPKVAPYQTIPIIGVDKTGSEIKTKGGSFFLYNNGQTTTIEYGTN